MRVALTVALAVLALVGTGCASTTSGHGTSAGVAVSRPASAPATPRSAGLPGVLAAKLMKPPAGSTPFASAWARNHTPTVAQFTAWDYGPTGAARESARLKAEGIARIAHETWIAPDADEADMALLQFSDGYGALSRFLGATVAEAGAAGVRSFAVPSVAGALGFYHTALDSVGNIRAVLYARVGDTVVEEFYFSPARLRSADAIAWLAAQVRLLR